MMTLVFSSGPGLTNPYEGVQVCPSSVYDQYTMHQRLGRGKLILCVSV